MFFLGDRRVPGPTVELNGVERSLKSERFDSALGGLGGCPFAQDALVGNIPTERVIETLRQRGAELPALKPLDSLLKATAGIGAKFSSSHEAD